MIVKCATSPQYRLKYIGLSVRCKRINSYNDKTHQKYDQKHTLIVRRQTLYTASQHHVHHLKIKCSDKKSNIYTCWIKKKPFTIYY